MPFRGRVGYKDPIQYKGSNSMRQVSVAEWLHPLLLPLPYFPRPTCDHFDLSNSETSLTQDVVVAEVMRKHESVIVVDIVLSTTWQFSTTKKSLTVLCDSGNVQSCCGWYFFMHNSHSTDFFSHSFAFKCIFFSVSLCPSCLQCFPLKPQIAASFDVVIISFVTQHTV